MARGTRKQTLIGDMADPIEFPHALATYVDVEMRAGRVPDVPLSALKEACELRTPDTAAVIESFRALFSSREASPRLRGARAPTLVDAFSCECAPSTGHVLRWSSHGGVATPSSPVRMLREALSDSKMPELPMNPFRFDPAAYPAADQSVFVVSSDSFPDTESWHAFCEANVKADLALATLNQIAAQFLRSLGEADAAKPAAPASATAAAITAAPAGASASSTTTPSEPAQPPSAGHFEGMPLINPGAALAACVRGIPGADAGVLEACPLTADEERELTQLCESVAKAALGRQPPHPLPPHVVASQCDEVCAQPRRRARTPPSHARTYDSNGAPAHPLPHLRHAHTRRCRDVRYPPLPLSCAHRVAMLTRLRARACERIVGSRRTPACHCPFPVAANVPLAGAS